jgi:Flp pilus assembly protein TadD
VIAALRSAAVHLGLAVLGGWALWAQFFYRTPQAFLPLLLTVLTLAATALTLTLWVLEAFRALGVEPRHERLVVWSDRTCAVAIIGFALWGLVLFANGKLDRSEPTPRATQIVAIAAEESTLGTTFPFTWVVLRGWQTPARDVRLLVRSDERWRLWGGQPVIVLVRRGFFGLSWVSAIEPDAERQSREVLKVVPDAAEVWKQLVMFHVRLGRFEDARRAASEYAAHFPDDPEFPVQVASILISRDRFADVTALLGPVAEKHQHAAVFMYLGYALGMQGRGPAGVEYLQRARELEPDNWWPHYGLGWVLAARGDMAGAVRSFERALDLRPGLADVEQELRRIRPLVTPQHAETATFDVR